MANTYDFSIIRIEPDPRRGEVVNIGIVIYSGDGLDVRILPNLRKVHALFGDFNLKELYDLPKSLSEWGSVLLDKQDPNEPLAFGPVEISARGTFTAVNKEVYQSQVSNLLKTLVSPTRAWKQRKHSTRLTTDVKQIFKKQSLLGESADDVLSHLIVPHYPIAEDQDLYADFALKNGVYQFTETLDFRVSDASLHAKFGQTAVSALTLDKAKKRFGKKTKRIVLYAAKASVDRQIIRHLNLVSDHADMVLNFESRSDRAIYVEDVLSALGANTLRPST